MNINYLLKNKIPKDVFKLKNLKNKKNKKESFCLFLLNLFYNKKRFDMSYFKNKVILYKNKSRKTFFYFLTIDIKLQCSFEKHYINLKKLFI